MKNDSEDMFSGYDKLSSKTRVVYICKNSIGLWLSLTVHVTAHMEGRKPTREEYKKGIYKYPYLTPDCRCKDCRYNRVVKGK